MFLVKFNKTHTGIKTFFKAHLSDLNNFQQTYI